MSDIRISELPLIATPASLLDADVYPLVNNGVTQKVQFDTLYTKISSVILTDVVFNSEFSTLETVVGSNSGNWNSTYSTVGANSASWGTTTVNILTALSLFREISSSSTPNTSDWPAHGLSAYSLSATNVDFVLRPKGTGAVLVSIPDGTSAGGSKRGQYAVDLQRIRGAASQIASGTSAVIGGGISNTASGNWSQVGGGSGNAATNTGAVIGGGASNTASGEYSSILGGQSNNINGNSNAHIIGSNITAPSANYTYVNNISTSGNVASNTAAITNLTATNVTAASGVITNSQITNLTATNVTATSGVITNSQITNLTATNSIVTNLTASNATITTTSISGSNFYYSTRVTTITGGGSFTIEPDFLDALRHYIVFNVTNSGNTASINIKNILNSNGSEIQIYLFNNGAYSRDVTIYYQNSVGGSSYSLVPLAVSPSSVGQDKLVNSEIVLTSTGGFALVNVTNINGNVVGFAV